MAQHKGRGSVIWQATMSLDGYIAAAGDDMSWVFQHIDPADPGAAAVPERLGAVIAGRRSFEVGRRDGMEVFDGAWEGSQFLLTNRPADGLPGALGVRAGNIELIIQEAITAARGRDVGIIGANVAQQCLEAGLIDEIVVHVAPVLLGNGVRFRGAEGMRELRLESAQTHENVVTLHYTLEKETS
ncbi:dihydrofolate reductase family protein [uncultured Agrococcus sp.]|uniref:dihydrofolate reductase family protein n=1 Tax=uncultured Agrococcus sp. TaxID=382258 RepID=UPI0025FCD7A4|nr:dihydrofolate reductase family protein [uncultured Agrococcus sp.]